MNSRHTRWAARLIAVALAVPAFAYGQATNDRNRTGEKNAARPSGAGHAGADHGNTMMIGHALGMAIEGSSLQLMARQTAGNDAARIDQSKAGAERLQDLQKDARQSFEDANRLLRDAYNAVRNDERSSAHRLYNAASRYTKTLYALIGEPLAKSEQNAADTGRATGHPQGTLTAADMASIALVNHAVKEALDACKLRKLTRMRDTSGTAAETLRHHAQQMDAHSLRCVEKLAGNVQAANANPNTNANANVNANAAHGTPTIATLAQQARDLIQVIQDDRDERTESSR